MKTILELMTALSSAESVAHSAEIAIKSGLSGAKDIYLAYHKEKGRKVKELNEIWAECAAELTPSARSGAKGFAEFYYDWLVEGERTEQEAHDLIMSSDSQNVRNHLTHYLNIWALAESVRSGSRTLRTIGASKGKGGGSEGRSGGGASRSGASKAKAEPAWEYNDASPFADVKSAWENLKREVKSKRPRKTRLHPDKVAQFNDDKLTEAYNQAFKVYCQK